MDPGATDSWPRSVFDAAILRHLDPGSQDAIAAAGRVYDVADGAVIYREGESSESFFVVIAGSVALSAARRTEDAPSLLRTARQGDTFGEEATLPGVPRRATATGAQGARVAEIPVSVFRRTTGRDPGRDPGRRDEASRSGSRSVAERERRYLHRAVTRDLIATSALGRELPEEDAAMLLDAAELKRHRRGSRIFEAGDRAASFFLVLDGLVQIQDERDGKVWVQAYLSRGDFFGDAEIIESAPRAASAVAMGDSWCARIPAEVLRTISDRNPGLLGRLRRISQCRRDLGDSLASGVPANSTQHVFKDLYRMQMARSLLVIDQDTCVRCGHCAWSCAEVHGVSRLLRRGDKILASLGAMDQDRGPGTASLLLPNSCQHCRNAACMVDCPTGAIGRDLGGEVFIRESLCTGCGNCAKSCPWENIQLAPRPAATPGLSRDVAVKCDLCRDYQAPACVQSCPTGSIFRLDPTVDIAEVAEILDLGRGQTGEGREARAPRSRLSGARWLMSAAVALAIALTGAAMALPRGAWTPDAGPGLLAGILAAVQLVALAGYAVPKRMVRLWMRRRDRTSAARRAAGGGSSEGATGEPERPGSMPRSAVRPHRLAHMAIGLLAVPCVVAHAGAGFSPGPAGALHLAFWLTAGLGGLGAVAYWLVPGALARLERRGALPEDLRGERQALFDRLYTESTGTGDLVKTLMARVLVPYARSPLGSLALVLSGRTPVQERRRLRRRIDDMLQGRGQGKLDGLEPLITTVVELRALPARRVLTGLLRAWLPVHIIATAVVLAMLGIHVLTAVLL